MLSKALALGWQLITPARLLKLKLVRGTFLAEPLVKLKSGKYWEGDREVRKKFLTALTAIVLGSAGLACNTTETANVNANANTAASETTRPGPDGSEITTSVDANGTRTETRVFHNNPRVAKVVVTTRDGKRTTTVYAPSGESKDLGDNVSDALSATGNALAASAGWVADKTEDVGNKAVEGAKTAAEKTGDAAKTVGEKTASGAKKVGEKTAEGAKKTGSAIKKAVSP
jgi:hypothetical protein